MWTELAREVGEGLPAKHLYKHKVLAANASGLMSLGFSRQAQHEYENAIRLIRNLQAENPGVEHLNSDLADCYADVGALHRALGDTKSASSYLKESQRISQE